MKWLKQKDFKIKSMVDTKEGRAFKSARQLFTWNKVEVMTMGGKSI